MKTEAPARADCRTEATPRESFRRTFERPNASVDAPPKRRSPRPPTEPAPAKRPGTPGSEATSRTTQARALVRELIAAGDRVHGAHDRARLGHQAQAANWTERTNDFEARDVGRHEARVIDQVGAEVTRQAQSEERTAMPPLTVGGLGAASAQTTASVTRPETRAEAAMQLVQKIEVWLKTSRPALTLGVGGALQAEVTVERTGPNRIALSLRGRNGPPSHSDVRAVRDALEQRGLLLTSVRIA